MRLPRSICLLLLSGILFSRTAAWGDVIDDHAAFEETLDGALLDLQGGRWSQRILQEVEACSRAVREGFFLAGESFNLELSAASGRAKAK